MEEFSSVTEKELVSIIIPTHNRADLICETLDSIKNQTYKSIEIVVVDDHSEDKTFEIVEEYIEHNPEVKIKIFKNDGKGACAARNKGIRESKGAYLQFFDDDDLMFENHIESKVIALRDNNYDYIGCDFSYFDDETKECVGHKIISTVDHNCSSHLLTKSFPCPCFMCTREAIAALGYWNENIKKLQDMVYFQRLFLLNMKGVYLQKELFKVRIHKGSMTSRCVAVSDGYYSQAFAYSAIKKEWMNINKKDKSTVLKTLLFLEYTVGRNMYLKGFKKQGIKMILETLINNFSTSLSFLKVILKYRTFHITNALIKENRSFVSN